MKWKDKLLEWMDGKILKIPPGCKKAFYWETSYLTKKMNEEYKEVFIQNNYLDKMKQNYKTY